MKPLPIIVLGALVGAAIGLGLYTFVYAKGYSYLTNNPQACSNCHVMQEYYDGWVKSAHHTVAVCNDCHTPHTFAGKYATKMENGFFHSLAFTSGRFPDNIIIRERDFRGSEITLRSDEDQHAPRMLRAMLRDCLLERPRVALQRADEHEPQAGAAVHAVLVHHEVAQHQAGVEDAPGDVDLSCREREESDKI